MTRRLRLRASVVLSIVLTPWWACDDAPPDRNPGGLATTVAALSQEAGPTATSDSIRIDVPIGNRALDAKPIRRVVVAIVEPKTDTVLETIEHLYAAGEAEASLPLVLPRSFDALAVSLRITAFDEAGRGLQLTAELPARFADMVPRVADPVHERTSASATLLDRAKPTSEKEAP